MQDILRIFSQVQFLLYMQTEEHKHSPPTSADLPFTMRFHPAMLDIWYEREGI